MIPNTQNISDGDRVSWVRNFFCDRLPSGALKEKLITECVIRSLGGPKTKVLRNDNIMLYMSLPMKLKGHEGTYYNIRLSPCVKKFDKWETYDWIAANVISKVAISFGICVFGSVDYSTEQEGV